MGILDRPKDRQISCVECSSQYLDFMACGNGGDEYYFTRDEIEIIARHMGLMPETPKKPLPSECKTAAELVEHYKGVKLRCLSWNAGEWVKPDRTAVNKMSFIGQSERGNLITCTLSDSWEIYEEPEQEAETPAPPEITNEQHFAIWPSALVAAFREALRKGGGE